MNKKNKKAISSYYAQEEVVDSYDKRRFQGAGGSYVNDNEVSPIVSVIERYANPGANVLDIGAGRGRVSIPLKEAGFAVHCLDSSQEMMSVLEKHIDKKRLFLQSAFDSLPNVRFDVITSLRFFDHFSLNDMEKLLSNISRALDRDGKVVFTCLNKNSIEALLAKFFYYDSFNFYYTPTEYAELFTKRGFKIIHFHSGFFIPRGAFLVSQRVPFGFQLLSFVDKALHSLFPKKCAYLVYVLKK